MNLKPLKELVEGKSVCIIGSTKPPGFKDDYDLIIRCNDHWIFDQGRCEVLFHIGASHKIKVSFLLQTTCLEAGLKILCLYSNGAEAKKMERIASFHELPVVKYDKQSEELKKLRRYFELRGCSPSTGLIAVYTLCLCEPKRLHYTGADLYASEPEHDGWHRHGPVHHVVWFKRLIERYSFFTVGSDVAKGIEYWEALDEDCNIE